MIMVNRFRIILVLALATMLVFSACSFSGQGQSEIPQNEINDPSLENEETTELDCESKGYPCTYADVDPKVLQESFTALDDAVAAMETGDSIQAAVEYLESRGDVVEILAEPEGIRFRLKEGPPLWLLNAEAVTAGSKAPGSGFGTATSSIIGPGSPLIQSSDGDDGPIGESIRGEEPSKKALLLSPFYWDFNGDETDLVRLILQKERSFNCPECEIVAKKNTVPAKTKEQSQAEYETLLTFNIDYQVTLDDFRSWHQYDLIHLSTHGIQICDEGSCAGMLMTGIFIDLEGYESALEVYAAEAGVEWAKLAVPGCGLLEKTFKDPNKTSQEKQDAAQSWYTKGCGAFLNRYWQLVSPDFFKINYSGTNTRLNDKMIFMSACESMKDLTLANAIAGENTTVYGWTEAVNADGARDTAVKFYEFYVYDALRAKVSWNELKNSLINDENNPVLRRYKPKGIRIESIVPPEFELEGDNNTRGREIITLMQPIYRVELKEKDAIPTIGAAGDGENDQLLFLVQIDGIDQELNPDDFVVHIAVDGQELDQTFRPKEKVSEYSYWILDEVQLPFDAADRDFIELEAWVELPTGGESRHVLEEVELANCGWTGNLSGGKSGKLAGEIVFPKSNLTKANVEELAMLADQGFLGPEASGSGMPSSSDFANLPDYTIFGSRSQFPFMLLIPGQGGTVMLESTSFGVGQQAAINLSEDSQERVEGSFSTSVTDLASQSGYSVEGDLIWHVDSFCSLDVILELAANPLPEGLVE